MLKHFFNLQCNKSCGDDGYRHRQVRCQNHLGEFLPDTSCSALDQPANKMKCNLQQCYPSFIDMDRQYEWRVGTWDHVSKKLLHFFFCGFSITIDKYRND